MSNYHHSKFIHDEIPFYDLATAFEYSKAKHFKDHRTAFDILVLSKTPFQSELMGRNVENYNTDEWNNVKRKIMLDLLLSKFSQNPQLRQWLKNTKDAHLAEISSIDRNGNVLWQDTAWGISLTTNSPEIKDPSIWNQFGDSDKGLLSMIVRELINLIYNN